MQVQESSPEPSPIIKDGPLKANLKPTKRRSHGRSQSHTSDGSRNDIQANGMGDKNTEIATEVTEVTEEKRIQQTTDGL